LEDWGDGNILSPDENGRRVVATCGAFDGLGMLQQNKGCSLLCGPVAQLGARFHGMEEVIGSIPIRSTKITPAESKSYRRLSLLRETRTRAQKRHTKRIRQSAPNAKIKEPIGINRWALLLLPRFLAGLIDDEQT
jgi:hypothetical protein